MPPAPVSESTAPRATVLPPPLPGLGVAVPVVVLLVQAERASMQIASTTAAAPRPNFRSPVSDMARNATDLRARKSWGGHLLSCRGALGQGRSADNSPFFLHGCEGSCCATQGSRWSARSAARTNDLEDGGEQQDDPAARRR